MAKRSTPGLNTSSMADISFLLLAFFLMVSSINNDLGIHRTLPQPLPDNVEKPEVRQRNIFQIKISSKNKILFNGEIGDLAALKEKAKEFLRVNTSDDPRFPETKDLYVNHLGNIKVSKGVISLQNDRGTSYEKYFQVQNELTAAINEMRDEMAMTRFSKSFDDLDTAYQNAIKKAIPVAISEAEPVDKTKKAN